MKYVEILNDETMRRNILKLADDTKDAIRNHADPKKVCAELQGGAEKIADTAMSNSLITSLSACMDFYNHLDELSCSAKPPYVSSGYEDVDRILGGGFMNEGLYILAARPACGKTTLALNIAEKATRRGIPTLFMSLEMSVRQITAKRIAAVTGITYSKILMGDILGEEFKAISDACSLLSDYPLVINRKSGATVEEIGLLARQVKDLGFVVIDYLGQIYGGNGKSIYERTTDVSNNLKRLARTLGVPILCLAQLNREVEGRQTNKPKVSELRDSGAVEQDADGVLLLYRDQYAEQDETTPVDLNCVIGKNRHGRTGELRFKFFMSNGRIYSTKLF